MLDRIKKNSIRLCIKFIACVLLIYLWWGISLAAVLPPGAKIDQILLATLPTHLETSRFFNQADSSQQTAFTSFSSNDAINAATYQTKITDALQASYQAQPLNDVPDGTQLAMAQVPSADRLSAGSNITSPFKDHTDNTSTSQYQPLLLAVTVNHQNTKQTTLFLEDKQKQVWASQEDLESWRFNVAHQISIPYENKFYYALHGFEGLQYTINMQALSIDIEAPASHFQPNSLSISQGALNVVTRPSPGGFFNYDTSIQTQSGDSSQVGGIGEVGIFNKYGVGTSNFLFSQSKDAQTSSTDFVRLNTTWTDDMPDKMRSVRFGDSYSKAGMWGQSVGFGGLQFASNFNTQPNFLTTPLPSTTGEAVLPSTVNLYVNNALVSSKNVNPGAFDITSIPVINGYGDLTVVTTDLLGRQQTYTLPYYSSSEILTPGLHDYSYEMGFIRNNLGTSSADYGKFVIAGTDTVGITDHFTSQWHTELLTSQQTAGLGGNYIWSTYGVWNIAGAMSQSNGNGIGGLAQLGFQHSSGIRPVNWGSNLQATTARFMNLGVQPGQFAPSLQSQSFLGFVLPKAASIGISYTLQNNRSSDNASLLSMSYSKTFFKKWALGATVLTNIGGTRSNGVFLTLNRTLNERTNFSLSGNAQTDIKQASAQINRPLPLGTGYGYNLSAGADANHAYDYQAAVSAQNNIGTYTAAVASQDGNQGYRAGVAGGVVYLGGRPYLTRQMTDSFAVVETGVPNVHVYEFNQVVGKTDKNGNMLLPNLMPYQNNKIAVESKDLPLNAIVDSTQTQVLPYYRSGMLVKFPIRVSRNATLVVVDHNDRALPLSVTATINQNNENFPVGEDGVLFLAGLEKKNKITVHLVDSTCQFDLDYPETTDPLPDLGTYICQ